MSTRYSMIDPGQWWTRQSTLITRGIWLQWWGWAHCKMASWSRSSITWGVASWWNPPECCIYSYWYFMYVLRQMIRCNTFHCTFRRCFHLPYDQFLVFVAEAREQRWFPRWGKWNANIPLELLILGAFHYLGRGWTFDDLEESTAISAETHRIFFHQFIHIGNTTLYPRYVTAPQGAEEATTHMNKSKWHGLMAELDLLMELM